MAARRHFFVIFMFDRANARQPGKSLIFRAGTAD